MSAPFRGGDALLLADVPNDFCPGGALTVPRGDEVVPIWNAWIARAVEAGVPIVVDKGKRATEENDSVFDGTGLASKLCAAGVRRVFVGGLALDYCVRATVLDAIEEGFAAVLIHAGARPVDVSPGDGGWAVAKMREAGAETA